MIGFGLSKWFWLSAAILMVSGMCDGVSVVLRSTIMQLSTPDDMRGRVSSINGIFVGSSNELGAFWAGSMARLLGLVPAVVVGGCVGTDAHTVGIDAILNIKGFAGEKGLEYYRELKVVNLGAQVAVPELVNRAVAEKADAVLVSQVVTQRDAHLLNTREMSAAFREAFDDASRPLLVVGGPRFDEAMAPDLGVDRIFTRGTTPGEVASYLVHRLVPDPERKAS